MKLWILVVALFIGGCAISKPVDYSPEPVESKEQAASIIEQVVMQQPLKYRPEGVYVTDEYIAMGEGYSSKGVGLGSATAIGSNGAIGLGVSKSTTKGISTRLYFNSLGPSKLWIKRDWYLIDVQDKTPRRVKQFLTRDKKSAEAFIDSINYMVEQSTPIK